MKVLILSAYFPPYNAIGALRVGKMAKFMVDQGHDVRVVSAQDPTLQKNAAVEINPEHITATKWLDLHSIPRYFFSDGKKGKSQSNQGGGLITRLYDLFHTLFHWPDRHMMWFFPARKASCSLIEEWKPDVIYASAWPITSLFVARSLSKKYGIPWIAEFRDLWVDNHYYQLPSWRRKIDVYLEKKLLETASSLVTVSEPLADILREKYKKPTVTILNGFDPADFVLAEPPEHEDKLVISYTGMIYPGRRDPTPLFLALVRMGEEAKRIKVRFYGRILPGVQALIDQHNLQSVVEIHAPVPHKEALRIQKTSDILLLLLWDCPEEKGVFTGKLFEYLGARKKILSLGLENGVAADLIRERNVGVVSNSPDVIASQLIDWITEKDQFGHLQSPPEEALLGFSRNEQFSKLIPYLDRAVENTFKSQKVIYLTNKLDVGGTERHLLQILPKLRGPLNPELYVLAGGGSLQAEMSAAGIRVFSPPSFLGRWLGQLWTTLRLFVRFSLDRNLIVHFFLPESYIIGGISGALTRHPRLVMSRRSLNYYQSSHPIAKKIELSLHRYLSFAVGNSQAVNADLKSEGIADDKLRLIYNGVDVDKYNNDSLRDELRSRLGIGRDDVVILVVANLIKYKGHIDLLEGLSCVSNEMPERWRLILVVRDGGEKNSIELAAQQRGLSDNILFLGEYSEVESIYSVGDIAVLPSHQEGFSNSILEGMASSLPLVVTSVGGSPEAVKDGETGFVVPPHDPGALGKAIATLVNDSELRRQFGRAGLERVEKHFSFEHCVDSYKSLYKEVVGTK